MWAGLNGAESTTRTTGWRPALGHCAVPKCSGSTPEKGAKGGVKAGALQPHKVTKAAVQQELKETGLRLA